MVKAKVLSFVYFLYFFFELKCLNKKIVSIIKIYNTVYHMLKFKINYLELMQIMLRAPVKNFSVIIPIVSIFFLFLSRK